MPAETQGRVTAINQELAALFAEFQAKVQADENTWVVLEQQADLAGLPASLVASAKAAADERKLEGRWVVVNTRSSVDPFLTFSTRRDLREKVWRNFVNRGDNGNANDTNDHRAHRDSAPSAPHAGFDPRAWRMRTRWRGSRARPGLMLRV